MPPDGIPIRDVKVTAYRVPTDAPESDGTLTWDATTLVLAHVEAGGQTGLGYGYADRATATLIGDTLAGALHGHDALDTAARWHDMQIRVRNLGRQGIAAMAISVLDVALWDLKAKCLGVPLARLLGRARESIPAYGSGGFTSYDDTQLATQLQGWAERGLPAVKMKVGREPSADAGRVGVARRAIGAGVSLFVDANGAYGPCRALQAAETFADYGVQWFEEPVSSDDLESMRLVRERAPAGMSIAAGEYGYESNYFRRMLAAGAVDVLQADATRCGGISGFMQADALCQAHGIALSSHCAPALHTALCCAAASAIHAEYFHDHVRIEDMLFEGVPQPREGQLFAQCERPGLGLEFKEQDATCFQIL